jgi:hypothetical protein
MSSTKFQAKIERFEKGNAEAAFIILSDPGRYSGLVREWAVAFAYRMVTTAAGRYLELERLWARIAYDARFPGPESSASAGLCEEGRDELSDVSTWSRW